MTTFVEDIQSKKVPWALGRFPQTNAELWYFVRATWGVNIPTRAVCDGHVAPFQAFADAYFARYPTTIWKASRGFGGKTFLLSLLGQTEMVALGASLSILGGSGEQSLRVHEAMQTFWAQEGAPVQLLAKEPTKYDTVLTNGAHARTLMASSKSVRGSHPQRLRLDEIDEMDWEILHAAQGQTMRSKRVPGVDTQTVMSSTHQYPDGTMSKMLEEAANRDWPVYNWCFRESSAPGGWLQMEEVERKKSEVSKFMWETEYELQEPSFEGRAIETEYVEAMFRIELGHIDGRPNRYFEFVAPKNNRTYITGVDWAKEKDWTIIKTYDISELPWRVVAWQRSARRPWPHITNIVKLRMERYGGFLIHDNTGIGDVIHDYLELPKGFLDKNVKDQQMQGRARSEMLTDYIAAIESYKIVSPRIEYEFNEHRFATNEELFGNKHLPDTIAAGALAWYLRDRAVDKIRAAPLVDGDLKRGVSPWRVT